MMRGVAGSMVFSRRRRFRFRFRFPTPGDEPPHCANKEAVHWFVRLPDPMNLCGVRKWTCAQGSNFQDLSM